LELNNKAGEIVSKCKFINTQKYLFTDYPLSGTFPFASDIYMKIRQK